MLGAAVPSKQSEVNIARLYPAFMCVAVNGAVLFRFLLACSIFCFLFCFVCFAVSLGFRLPTEFVQAGKGAPPPVSRLTKPPLDKVAAFVLLRCWLVGWSVGLVVLVVAVVDVCALSFFFC